MNILWTTNITLPAVAERIGLKKESKEGWLSSLADNIKLESDVRLGIISFEKSVNSPIHHILDGVNYYIIPTSFFNNSKENLLNEEVNTIKEEFAPNLLHINGTEYGYALDILKLLDVPSAISIQGLVSICARYTFTGISVPYLIKNPLFFLWLYRNYIDFSKSGERERLYFQNVGHAIGRTEWDKYHVQQINPKIKYHHCDENMRKGFYNMTWDIKSIRRHQIYISQASYQVKGFHLIIEALAELKKNYPDLYVCIAGKNPLEYSNGSSDKIKSHFDYGHYLKKLIKRHGLEETIHFVGNLSEEEVVKNMLMSHVTVLPSTIENSPNSLCEAQCLGVPCVASYIGGTPDLTKNGTLSLLYRCEEWEFLVQHVRRIFENDDFALALSKKAREVALIRHNHKNNAVVMTNIYKEIINQEQDDLDYNCNI